MAGLPTASATPDATFVELVGPNAKPAALKKAIEAESVWLPKAAAGGHGLRADDLLRFTVAIDRADNVTGNLTWRAKSIDRRCGITAKKPKPITKLLAQYIDGGLLADQAVTYPPGRAPQVTIDRAPAANSLRIPLGVGWEYRWSEAAPTGPRYGDDTRYVFVWLAAWLLTANYVSDGVVYTSIENYTGLPMPAAWIAEQAGLTARTYRRAWDTVRRVCADDAWVSWERETRDDDGHDAYRITIDWSLAPVLKPAPVEATPPISGQGTPSRNGQRDPLVMVTLSSTNASTSLLPSQAPAVPTGGAAITQTNKAKRKGGTNGGQVVRVERQAKTATGDADISAALQGQAPKTPGDDAYRHWWLTVIAGITAPENDRRLVLDIQAARSAAEPLKRLYDGGWAPDAASAWLTHSDNSNVRNAGSVLRTRLDERTTPTAPPRATRTMGETAREARERLVLESIANSRSSDKYFTTMPNGARILTPM